VNGPSKWWKLPHSDVSRFIVSGADAWGQSLNYLMGAVMGGGAIIMGIMAYMQKKVQTLCVEAFK